MGLRSLLTLVRGRANAMADAVVDANALQIMEQELRDADASVKSAAAELARLMAEEMALRRRIEVAAAEIGEREAQAKSALRAGNEDLAAEIAERLAALQAGHQRDAGTQRVLRDHVTAIRQAVADTERRLGDLRHEIVRLRAVDAAQRTENRVSRNGAEIASATETAEATAERIRQRQQRNLDVAAARRDLKAARGPGPLDDKLRAAGVIPTLAGSSGAILARLKSELNLPAAAPAN